MPKKTTLPEREAVLRKLANELASSSTATGGSIPFIEALNEYSKAANKAIDRAQYWSMMGGFVTALIAIKAVEGLHRFFPGLG
jgi:hypothetical protein